jgi:predicted O-methyltransferase YrrM
MKWYQNSEPDKVKAIPFLHPRVIDYLAELIKPDWRILEHGSGGSTLWFADRCDIVVAIEGNPDWLKAMQAKAPDNAFVYDRLVVSDANRYDLILIDGEPVEDRRQWIHDAPHLAKRGGVVVLDNANRPEYAIERVWIQSECESYKTFDGNETGTKYLVTEFYWMKK